MFDSEILQQIIYMLPEFIAEALFSCLYFEKFFSAKTSTAVRRCIWIIPYTLCDTLLFAVLPNTIIWHDAILTLRHVFHKQIKKTGSIMDSVLLPYDTLPRNIMAVPRLKS